MNNEESLGTLFRPNESYGNLLGEGNNESLQVGCLLSIFLYSPRFPFLFQVQVEVGGVQELQYHRGMSFQNVSSFSHMKPFVFSFIFLFSICEML